MVGVGGVKEDICYTSQELLSTAGAGKNTTRTNGSRNEEPQSANQMSATNPITSRVTDPVFLDSICADSAVSPAVRMDLAELLVVCTSTMSQSNAEKIANAQSNLPLPEEPPVKSDWKSADPSTVNVGSGGVSSDVSTGAGSSSGLREPASKGDVDLSKVGRQGHDNLDGPPKDAAK
ncbi:hypothetical protein JX265_006834 [Neoarthrinium moseri]|uniref:Uncharacterized protein n=1 Tax=Neoarthrinium moseri TaxID=1658444 RepID=A0A9Q0ANR7_9PEZI|nr:hypothetical protein JX265_006834 [Neoarthrinium moseri]